MKNLFSFILIATLTLTASAQRFATGFPPTGNNTGSALNYVQISKTTTGNDSISPNAYHSYYVFSKLTTTTAHYPGGELVTLKNASAQKFDHVTLLFYSDSIRVVTIESNSLSPAYTTVSGSTFTVKTNKAMQITFIYDGTSWYEEYTAEQY